MRISHSVSLLGFLIASPSHNNVWLCNHFRLLQILLLKFRICFKVLKKLVAISGGRKRAAILTLKLRIRTVDEIGHWLQARAARQ